MERQTQRIVLPPTASGQVKTALSRLEQIGAQGLAKRLVRSDRAVRLDDPYYQTRPEEWVHDRLGLDPWSGAKDPGQRELFLAIGQSVKEQLAGNQEVDWIFHIQSAHALGKSFAGAALVLWFFACFPSIIETTAPGKRQVQRLMWKDIRVLAERIPYINSLFLPVEPHFGDAVNHYAAGFTVSDAGGLGAEGAQGQHHPYHMAIYDEAEGVPPFQYDATKRQFTGNTVRLWLRLANPRTRTSAYYRGRELPKTKIFAFNALDFPNVVEGKTIVPNALTRATFNEWLFDHDFFGADAVAEFDEDKFCFILPWDVTGPDGKLYPAGTIWQPKRGFLYGALGIAPLNEEGNILVPGGRYEAAKKRVVHPGPDDCFEARLGIDIQRSEGGDFGTIYRYQALTFQRDELLQADNTGPYFRGVKRSMEKAMALGAKKISVRVDGTGGFGGGLIDLLRSDGEIQDWLANKKLLEFHVFEVKFGQRAKNHRDFKNIITEAYAIGAEMLRQARILNAPPRLETDLCSRTYDWVQDGVRESKRLSDKKAFKAKFGHSPDDGDGWALSAPPDRIFAQPEIGESEGSTVREG